MLQAIQRAYPRISCEAPIRYGVINGGNCAEFHDSRAFNYSPGGMCYEINQKLPPEAEVCIIMNDYAPGQSGPGCYRSYLTRICWIHPLSEQEHERFATGAQIIARSHEILSPGAVEPCHNCDLCGAMISACQLQCTEGNAMLCGRCYKHFQSLPEGKIRQCLERFMTGNVV